MEWEVWPSQFQILVAITEKIHGWRPPDHQCNHWNLQGLCGWKTPWAQVRSGEGKPSYMHLGADTFWYHQSNSCHIHECIKVRSKFHWWLFQIHMGFFIKKKSKVLETFTELKALIENAYGQNINILRYDNGGEYFSNYLLHICSQSGIHIQHSVPYTPQ